MNSNKMCSDSYYCDTIQQSPLQKSYESSDNLDLSTFSDSFPHPPISLENLLLQSPQDVPCKYRKLGLGLCDIKQIGFVLGRVSNKIREKQKEHCKEFICKLQSISQRQQQTREQEVHFASKKRREEGQFQLSIKSTGPIQILNLFGNSQIDSWGHQQNARKAYPVKCEYKQFPRYWQYYIHEHKPRVLNPQKNHSLQKQMLVGDEKDEEKKRTININKCSLKSKPV